MAWYLYGVTRAPAPSPSLVGVYGADEWVVQVDAHDTAGTTTGDQTDGLTPGHAFFARKRAQSRARADARQRADAAAQDLAIVLGGIAKVSRVLAPLEPGTVARAAYLVGRAETEAFVAATEGCEDANIVVHGPLPPYRFVDVKADPPVPR